VSGDSVSLNVRSGDVTRFPDSLGTKCLLVELESVREKTKDFNKGQTDRDRVPSLIVSQGGTAAIKADHSLSGRPDSRLRDLLLLP
jgi:hypothetical protein